MIATSERNLQGTNPPNIDTRAWMQLYLEGKHEELSREFLTVFDHYRVNQYVAVSAAGLHGINVFVSTFLYLIAQPDYAIPASMVDSFLRLHSLLDNLVSMSSIGTTDAALTMILQQPNNMIKIMVLYSARNTLRIERKHLFDADPVAASIWY
ncbi:MAG: hypothetical protein ACYCW6_12445, partial [Candidatus Xenobia bacterium]